MVHDVRIENRRPESGPSLEVIERVAGDLVPQSASIASSYRVIKAAEAGSNPVESQKLAALEERWCWLSHLRLKHLKSSTFDPSDPAQAALLRWVHVSSNFPEDLRGVRFGIALHVHERHAYQESVLMGTLRFESVPTNGT